MHREQFLKGAEAFFEQSVAASKTIVPENDGDAVSELDLEGQMECRTHERVSRSSP